LTENQYRRKISPQMFEESKKTKVNKMNNYDLLITRRSIRKYKDEKLSDSLLKKIIRAGCYAPSAMKKYPWRFVIIDDRKILDGLTEVHSSSKMLHDTHQAVLMCGDLDQAHTREYMMLDLSAAVQNILLAAHAEGVGSCWLGIYPREARMNYLIEACGLPANIMPFAVISLGYPDETKEAAERYDDSLVHYNRWQ